MKKILAFVVLLFLTTGAHAQTVANGKCAVGTGGTGFKSADCPSSAATAAALKALSPGYTSLVWLDGYYASGDGGEGMFTWVAGSSATVDNGVVFQPNAGGTGRWIRQTYSTLPNIKWWGAKCDVTWSGSAWIGSDDGGYYGAAVAWGTTQDRGARINVPRGCVSGLAGSVTINSDNISFVSVDQSTGIPLTVTDYGSCSAYIVRLGGSTSTMFTWGPTIPTATRGIIGGGMEGVCLNGNQVAANLIIQMDSQKMRFDIAGIGYTSAGFLIVPSATVNGSNFLSSVAGIQYSTYNLQLGQSTNGKCLHAKAWLGTFPTNASLNTFNDINCSHFNGAGVVLEADDNNLFNKLVSIGSDVAGQPDVDFSCSLDGSATAVCSSSDTVTKLTSPLTMIRGVTTFPTAATGANGVVVTTLDKNNGSATPTLEAGARFINVMDSTGQQFFLDYPPAGSLITSQLGIISDRLQIVNKSTAGTPDVILGHSGATGDGLTIFLSNNTNQMLVGQGLIQLLKPMRSTNSAAAASPSAGLVNVWTDSTDLRLHDKNSAGVIGTTVVADIGATNNFLTAISAAGAISKARPTCANLSDAGTGCTAAAGITALTGDVTASGSGSVAATLATVNSNVGSFGTATQASQVTVNAKGLVTAASNVTVTPLVSSLTDVAWLTYTPTITCGSGTITTFAATPSGRYKQIGKTVVLQLSINVSNAGTCASFMIATVPLAINSAGSGAGTYVGSGIDKTALGPIVATYADSGVPGIVMIGTPVAHAYFAGITYETP